LLNEGDRTEIEVKNVRNWGKRMKNGERKFEVYDEKDNCYLYYAKGDTKLLDFSEKEINDSGTKAKFSCTVEYVKDFGNVVTEYYDYVVSNPRLKFVD